LRFNLDSGKLGVEEEIKKGKGEAV